LTSGEDDGEHDDDDEDANEGERDDDASEEASDGSDGLKKRTKRRGSNNKPKPKVFYCTRTHSQIEQVVKELKRTSYRPQSVVLGSRENYCVNGKVKRSGNVNEECRRLMDESGEGKSGCYYAGQNASKLASMAKSSPVPLDIEDLVDMGKSKKGCPYFASKILAADSNVELIFAPYNYIMDPRTRAAMDIDIEGSLIIFDEAHNIEDVSREAAGGEVALEDVANALDNLDEMRKRITANSDECEMVFQSIKALYSWMLNICDPSKDEYGLEQVPQTTNAWSAMIRGERLIRSINCEHLTQGKHREPHARSLNDYEIQPGHQRVKGEICRWCFRDV
jgi:Fanconi anemia group J protein